MNEQTMDRLAKSVAGGFSRRRFLRRATGTVAAGVAAVGLGEQARWTRALAKADPEEQSVLLFEKLAEIVDEQATSCEELTEKVRAFRKANQDLLNRILADEATWSLERRKTHADTYGDRRWTAATKIQAAATRCQYSAKTIKKRRPHGHTKPATPAAATPKSAAMPELIPFAAELNALPAAQSAPQSCADTFIVECVNPNTDWASTESWTVTGSCTSPIDCIYCGESDDTCAQKYPDQCSGKHAEQCALSWITNDSCIYTLNAVCGNPSIEWQSDDNWTVPASCTSPTDCTPCGESGPSYQIELCAKRYPEQCGGQYLGRCGFNWMSDTSCTYPVQAVCGNPIIPWNSAPWNTFGNCNDDQSSCSPCLSNDICAAKFPAQCTGEYANRCGILWQKPTQPSSCCQKNCPVSTGDCVNNGFGSIFGDANCNACMLSWCGSTGKCLNYCREEDCCNQSCSEGKPPPRPPIGEGRTAGTPIPAQGSPAVATPTLTTPATVPATAPPTAPPTVAPTPPPATAPPTSAPGTPTAAPPPATGTATS